MRAKAILAISVFAGALTLAAPLGHTQGTARYVRDWLSIPLRETIDAESTVIHKGVVSGTELTLLQTDNKAGVTRVRTAEGVEGWIPTRYLTTEPGARNQLDKANAELRDLKKLNEQLRLGAPSVAVLQDRAEKQQAEAQAQIGRLTGEIDALKSNIGDNTRLVEDHAALSKHADELQGEVTRLNTELAEIRSGTQQEYFRDGALAVGGGALLTLIAARLWPRKRRTDWA